MSVELLYTSAPAGLRKGSRGFCTVVSTAGTPVNLAARLESLSGYKHLYATDSPDAGSNPVAYSHLKFTLAGQPTSVISRVAAFGADYSGRTNKLAHHLVVDRSEAPAAGPAWLLMQTGLMRTSWDGKCDTPAVGPTIPQATQEAQACDRWNQVMGDPGWGGVVADAFTARSEKPTWVIYTIEQRELLLPLLNEAIALLPIDQRWQATFSTYAAQFPPDIQCRVRCVVEGTEEARFAAARGAVLNLKQTPFSAADTKLIRAARDVALPEAIPTNPSPAPKSDEKGQAAAPKLREKRQATAAPIYNDLGALAPPTKPRATTTPPQQKSLGPPPPTGRRSRSRFGLILTIAASLLLLVGSGFGGRIYYQRAVTQAEPAELEADVRAQAKVDEVAKAEADKKFEAEEDARTKADAKAETDAKAEADARTKAEADAKAKADEKAAADARTRAEADAKAKADEKAAADEKMKIEADAKAKAEAVAKAKVEFGIAELTVDVAMAERPFIVVSLDIPNIKSVNLESARWSKIGTGKNEPSPIDIENNRRWAPSTAKYRIKDIANNKYSIKAAISVPESTLYVKVELADEDDSKLREKCETLRKGSTNVITVFAKTKWSPANPNGPETLTEWMSKKKQDWKNGKYDETAKPLTSAREHFEKLVKTLSQDVIKRRYVFQAELKNSMQQTTDFKNAVQNIVYEKAIKKYKDDEITRHRTNIEAVQKELEQRADDLLTAMSKLNDEVSGQTGSDPYEIDTGYTLELLSKGEGMSSKTILSVPIKFEVRITDSKE